MQNGLTDCFRGLLSGLWDDLRNLDRRVAELDLEINMIAGRDPVAKRLQQLRGVGPMIATALVAAVGNAEQFVNGRQMAASLGFRSLIARPPCCAACPVCTEGHCILGELSAVTTKRNAMRRQGSPERIYLNVSPDACDFLERIFWS